MEERNPENSNDIIHVHSVNPKKRSSYLWASTRQVNLPNKESCIIPEYVDDLYNNLKKTMEQNYNNTEDLNETVQCEIDSTHINTMDTTFEGTLCLSEVKMSSSFVSSDENYNMSVPCNHFKSSSYSSECCYCDKSQQLILGPNHLDCICKTEYALSYVERNTAKAHDYYYKMNCTIYTTNSYGSPVSKCTITDRRLPLEDLLFSPEVIAGETAPSMRDSIMNAQKSGYHKTVMGNTEDTTSLADAVMHAQRSSGSTTSNILATNNLQIVLLLLFHLFIYFGLLKKEFINTRRRTKSKL